MSKSPFNHEFLVDQLNSALDNAKQLAPELKDKLSPLIQSQITKLDLVTKAEFEAQQAIIEKLLIETEQLKSQIAELESTVHELGPRE